ncbi:MULTISPECIES: hypothetical protein [unclassified Stenotrophomonas]|uniref:hypothetical protein n=1 Tax=unclassified Stenotrophomonas TaxID=196198 RepID=UPI002448F4CF|nr:MULTISPECIES: hypothetical protein [unclassified Stenotrophomonas]MDH0276396.1 hypothetical protein [Stenotrophomonas sp. GD04089]MDH1911532.1 hypothetical protein [Stenotrophomonas sp. GD03794]
MSARIYDRPDLDQRSRLLPLLVVGDLPRAVPFVAYEGRLQIYNAVGGCTVRQIDGDLLPPGHQLYVDQATKQVVLTWPAYQAGAAPIANPGFESGPTGWDTGAGWVIAKENPPTGQWAAGYNNNRGESIISSTSRYEVYPGQRTTAKCKVRQGASAEGNAGASVLLEYRDQEGQVVGRVEGNRVMSASKNRVYDSNVVGIAPAGAATINIAGNGIRYRENKILFVDDFEWDHTVAAVGLDHEAEYRLTLMVSDSAGRSAIWRGFIGDHPIFFTSKPYAFQVVESAEAQFGVRSGAMSVPPSIAEALDADFSLLGGELRQPLVNFSMPPDALFATFSVGGGELRDTLIKYTAQPEALDAGLLLQSGTLRQILITTTMPADGIDAAFTINSGTLA